MNIHYSKEELAFRDEVREFLTTKLPADISHKVKKHQHLVKEDYERWHNILNEQGWLAIHWPLAYGGTGWSHVEQHIFDEEMSAAGGPRIVPFGVGMVAPVILKFGSEEQKSLYLPRILDSSDWWCQGYSEPGAGSDLASLKTRAVREGDHYVVNGQKTWTTLGQYANMIFCLVRTDADAKKQRGISFLLIDMDSPGITVRPIITLDGGHEVNEVFFEDVKVPVENLVGEENLGWTYAKYLLTYERTGLAGIGLSKEDLRTLKHMAGTQMKNGKPLIEDASFRQQLAQVEIDLLALEVTNLRTLAKVSGGGVPGAESSILKMRGTEVRQQISTLMRKAIGVYAFPYYPDGEEDRVGEEYCSAVAPFYFNERKLSIFGGSNEIQKNIISKMILGL